jgi:hypothetical protein
MSAALKRAISRRKFIVAGASGLLLPVATRAGLIMQSGSRHVVQDGGDPGTAPQWFLDLPEGEWVAICENSNQQITNVLPSPKPTLNQSPYSWNNIDGAIVNSWNGGYVDQSRNTYGFCANGGHADYAGNEIYELDLRVDTLAELAWSRRTTPTPTATMQAEDLGLGGDGHYTDDRSRSMHNTFQVWGDGRIWMPAQNSVCSADGGFSKRCVSFDRDSLGDGSFPRNYAGSDFWDNHGVIPTAYSGDTMKFGVAAFDRVGHKAWGLSGESANNTVYWSVDTQGVTLGDMTAYDSGQEMGSWTWATVAHDLGIMIAGDKLRGYASVLDLSDPGAGWTTPSVSGTGLFSSGGCGAVYDEANHCVYVGDPANIGNNVRKLVLPKSGSSYNPGGSHVWSNINVPGDTITISGGGNQGVYSKFNKVDDMGNGQGLLIFCGAYAGPTYVCKLPTGGLS